MSCGCVFPIDERPLKGRFQCVQGQKYLQHKSSTGAFGIHFFLSLDFAGCDELSWGLFLGLLTPFS